MLQGQGVLFPLLFLCAHCSVDSAGPVVLVTGATGRTGSLVYNQLKQAGLSVRGLVRNASKAREILKCEKCDTSEGIYVADITKKDTLAPAMHGATALAIVTSASPICDPYPNCHFPEGGLPIDIDWHGQKNQIETFDEANAIVQSHGFVVLVSTMGTTTPEDSKHGLPGFISFYKLNSEAYLMSSGIPFTVIKPCGLVDANASQQELVVGHDDELDASVPIARGDVARVVAGAITAPGAASGLRFDLCAKKSGTPTTDINELLRSARYPWEDKTTMEASIAIV
jgi:uncharacterized protein YbjT (DUF2867 family)